MTDRLTNDWVVNLSRLGNNGFPLPQLSPYRIFDSESGNEQIREILERYIDFENLLDLCDRTTPEFVVGTVNVNAGVLETFTNEAVTMEAALASAAVPTLYEAVEIDGHYHWDGLFSQNPPSTT